MTPIERQILENQKAMMEFMINPTKDFHYSIIEQSIKNDDLLSKETSQETPCEMPEEDGE